VKKENIFTKISIAKLAWIALVANVIVILQGAIVRVTGSGAGCGRHWPSCQGEVIPLNHSVETLIEFSHRSLSLIVLLLAVLFSPPPPPPQEIIPRTIGANKARDKFIFLITRNFIDTILEIFIT